MFYEPKTDKVYASLDEFRLAYPNTSFGDLTDLAHRNSVGLYSLEVQTQEFNRHFQELVLDRVDPLPTGGYAAVYVAKKRDMDPVAEAVAMDLVRGDQKRAIDDAWVAANLDSFVFKDKVITCDTLDRQNIDGTTAYLNSHNGAFPPGWPGGWKTKDNSYVEITTQQDWNDFIAAMVTQGMVNFAKAQSLKQTLAAATTFEDVLAVKW